VTVRLEGERPLRVARRGDGQYGDRQGQLFFPVHDHALGGNGGHVEAPGGARAGVGDLIGVGVALGEQVGEFVGVAVGLTGGVHRYSLGGFTGPGCAVSTTVEGLIGGLLHLYLLKRHRADRLLHPMSALVTTFVAELTQMIIILLMAKPFDQAERLVAHIALPMIVANSLGAALFMRLILDRRETLEKYSIAFSAKALRIAERSVGVLMQGFNENNCSRMAAIIREETGVGAVAITDCEKLLGFVGVGADHHLPGTPISSPHTFHAIAHNEVVYADGAGPPELDALEIRALQAVFGKRANGTLPPVTWVVLLPYLAFTWSWWRLKPPPTPRQSLDCWNFNAT